MAFDIVATEMVSNVTIKDSVFVGCSANRAGAIYTHNVTFLIENSSFYGNKATATGGAIEASVKPYHFGSIRNSYFAQNSANVGGGVKWTNAPVLFTNTTFTRNAAIYGADVASYGVTLSSKLTQLTGTEVSGKPLNLVFELLDHYENRVLLAPIEALILTSMLI